MATDNTSTDNLAVDVLGVVGDNVAGAAAAVGHLGGRNFSHFDFVVVVVVVRKRGL